MASQTSGIIFFSYVAQFSCLHLLEAATQMQNSASHSRFARIAAATFLVAVLIDFGLTQLLLFSYVHALGAGRTAGEGAGRRRLLAKATLLAATAALLVGAVPCLVASGYLGGGADDDDVGWPHRKK